MLHDFIHEHRSEILRRTRARVSARPAPHSTAVELEEGIPLFVDDLIQMLTEQLDSDSAQDLHAARHGRSRFAGGCTIAQVVHDYGDVCQVVTELAIESKSPISTEDFRRLNSCLDDAIARAVSQHAESTQAAQLTENMERLGIFAHELRNHLSSAVLVYNLLRSGTIAIGGSTGSVLGRSLASISDLVDRSLAEVRLDAGVRDLQPIDVASFLEQVEITASVGAKNVGMSLSVEGLDSDAVVVGDRQLLASATSNLLQNAFKFTHAKGHVSLRAKATPAHVIIEIEDECGGMPADLPARLFQPYQQGGTDRSGIGLGLLISKRAIESMNGHLSVRNVPGRCCVFTIELPRSRDVARASRT